MLTTLTLFVKQYKPISHLQVSIEKLCTAGNDDDVWFNMTQSSGQRWEFTQSALESRKNLNPMMRIMMMNLKRDWKCKFNHLRLLMTFWLFLSSQLMVHFDMNILQSEILLVQGIIISRSDHLLPGWKKEKEVTTLVHMLCSFAKKYILLTWNKFSSFKT